MPWKDFKEKIVSADINLTATKSTIHFFSYCENLQFVDLTDFNASQLCSMQGMFFGCKSLKKIEFERFDTSNVTDMGCLFYGCESLEYLDLSSFNLKKSPSVWGMFYGCKSLRTLDLSNFELWDNGTAGEFLTGCYSLESIETPIGVKYWVGLPTRYANEKWYLLSGIEIDSLPQSSPDSVTIVRKETDWFRDVYSSSWYTPYIEFVKENGLMSGYNRCFYPNEPMTRAMVVQTLYNMEGKPEITDDKACKELKDVYQDWYTDAVCWAYNEGITTGYEDTKKFEADKFVTREELVIFLYRYAKYKEYNTSQIADLSGLQNVDRVSPYAKDAVNWAVGSGLISGIEIKQNGTVIAKDLAPQETATRAQMAAILQRFYDTYNVNQHYYNIEGL